MSHLRNRLKEDFKDEEYRYAYAESHLNTTLAAQIKVLRNQRNLTQAEVAERMGTTQAGFSRFESVHHSRWKTDTLWKIAKALGVRVSIRFETFGTLITEKENFSRAALERPDFHEDPELKDCSVSEVVDLGQGRGLAGVYIESTGNGLHRLNPQLLQGYPIRMPVTQVTSAPLKTVNAY